MNYNKFYLIFSLLFICFFLFNCEKEKKTNFNENLTIVMEDLPFNQTYFAGDTIEIKYTVTVADIDSVCLFINGRLTQTQFIPKNMFSVAFDSAGGYEIDLKAFFSNNYTASSSTHHVMIFNLANPEISLYCTRIDGDPNYFVGEKLEITIKRRWDYVNMELFKEATMFLNDVELEKMSDLPFRFITDTIKTTINDVTIKLTDTLNYKYTINKVLEVPINTPPEIDFGFRYYYNIWPGYYYSIDPLIFSTSGKDNVEVSHLNYYIDDSFIGSDTLKDDYFLDFEKEVDPIGIGKHSCYCVAYDDRGDSTVSERLDFVIYKAYSFTEEFIDIGLFKNRDITYAISTSRLYRIDNVNEIVDSEYTLPFSNPIGLYMCEASKLLYVGFANGTIVHFNDDSRTFVTVVQQAVSGLSDFEIDNGLSLAIVIANSKLQLIDLNSNEVHDSGVTLESGSSLAINIANKIIIAGGNPGISRSDIFKLSYTSNSVEILKKENLGGYAEKILLDPMDLKFIVLPYTWVYNEGYYTYDITDFSNLGKYSRNNLHRGCYGNLKPQFFAGDDYNKQICVFNKSDYMLADEYYIPTKSYMDFNKIISSADDSKLIISTAHVFEDKMTLIFLRL
ncbi:MAG: hypothetical protein PHH42_09325 [Bacteroidales bacterium]|nr:hypothetical protein [Bacteroidales bacterium]